MKLNEYGIFEYGKNGHSLGALVTARVSCKLRPLRIPLVHSINNFLFLALEDATEWRESDYCVNF